MVEKSPHSRFLDWLFVSNMKAPLDEDLKNGAVSRISILNMFGSMGKLTITLNDLLNNYELSKIDFEQFALFVKNIVLRNNIKRKDFSYFTYHDKNEVNQKIINKLKYIKSYEIPILLNAIQNRPDYDQIAELLELNKKQKIKKTRSKKK
jgi:3-oxoacyl-[acyl-carrier-protein] synthase III